MSRYNDGGPAFPNVSGNARGFDMKPGNVSVRDYFAAAALQYLGRVVGVPLFDYEGRVLRPNIVAEETYRLADAMLTERERKESP